MNIGIDMGGTSAKVALVNDRNRIVDVTSVPTGLKSSPPELAKRLAAAVKKLAGRHVRRIGVGVAGDIDSHHGIVRISPNLGWKRVPLKMLLQRATGNSVAVENDANVAAWGIYKTETPSSVKSLIAITLGTGVGGGIVIDGQLHRGATGSAGEIGHMVLDPKGRLCNCGMRGCLETCAGGTHLSAIACEALKKGAKSRLQKIYKANPQAITPKVLTEAARAGDRLAQSLWENAGRALGRAVGDLIYVINPERIVFTGGVAQAGSLLFKPLQLELSRRPFKTPIRVVSIAVAKNPAHIGVLGAALL